MNYKRLVYVAGLSNDHRIGHYVRDDINNIKSILETHENNGEIILRVDEWVTKSRFMSRFRNAKILPWLCYYSGHSDEHHIAFSDGNVSTNTFVNFFSNSRVRDALALMFLGSCNSIEIGQKLIHKKIKTVIVSTKDVQPHLANIVSRLFFNRFFIAKNIQEAYDLTLADYEFDRSTFNVNGKADFPWELLTSSKTNLIKGVKQIKLTSTQRYQLIMNAASIRLDLLNYYIHHDVSENLKIDKLKREVLEIRDIFDETINITNESENIKSLIHLWKGSQSLESLPNEELILKTSKKIRTIKFPETFISKVKNNASHMINVSNTILNK